MRKFIWFILILSGCSQPTPSQGTQSLARAAVEQPYSVVIDAGSSGSRVYVYKNNGLDGQGIPMFEPLATDPSRSRALPGIATLANRHSDELKTYLNPLLIYARSLIPDGINLTTVTVYLGATAGVRNLVWADQLSLMKMASRVLEGSGMLFQGAEAISGQFEGFFAWTSANYLKKTLGGDPEKTVGIIEIGGASLQITFVPEEQPSSAPIRIGGTAYPLYSYSYNHLGINEANQLKTVVDCANGTGNFGACKAAINKVLDADHYCQPNCGVEGVSQPPPWGNFLMIGGLPGGLASGCGFSDSPLIPNKLDLAGEKLCNQANQDAVVCPSVPSAFLGGYCFNFALISSLLSGGEGGASGSNFNALGFAKDATSVTGVANIEGKESTWTLGYLILNATGNYVNQQGW